MKAFLNGKEIPFKDGGYEYIFMKPYQRSVSEKMPAPRGELTIQMYDNGVQIRTLVTPEEVSTLVNREVAVDYVKKVVYILEQGNKVTTNPDGSLTVE